MFVESGPLESRSQLKGSESPSQPFLGSSGNALRDDPKNGCERRLKESRIPLTIGIRNPSSSDMKSRIYVVDFSLNPSLSCVTLHGRNSTPTFSQNIPLPQERTRESFVPFTSTCFITTAHWYVLSVDWNKCNFIGAPSRCRKWSKHPGC